MHATFRPFRHRNIKKWTYGVIIAGVLTLTAMILIPLPLISLYGNLHQQRQLVFPLYLWRSYCFLCLIVICVSYTSIALKFWCGTRPQSHGAANRQRKLTVTYIIYNDHCIFAVVVTRYNIDFSFFDCFTQSFYHDIFTFEIVFYSSIPHKLAC